MGWQAARFRASGRSDGHKSFILDYRPHGGGRAAAKRRLTIGTYGAPVAVDQARKTASDALARVRLGRDPQQEKIEKRAAVTVADLIDAFLADHVTKHCKPSTAQRYKIAFAHLRREHGPMKAQSLNKGQVAALHSQTGGGPYAANRFLAIVSKLCAWGVERGLLPDGHISPVRRIKKNREIGRERFLTSDELARLGDALREGETIGLPYVVDESKPKAKHAAKPDNRRAKLHPFAVAAIRLLILTGARLREVLHAQWQHVDFERGVIFLPDSKTGRKPVYLSATALEVLASLPWDGSNPHIIAGARDGQSKADLKRPWAAVTRAAGLEGVRIHDLRHGFASIGAGASLGLPVIGKLLGHSQAATTHRTRI